MSTPYAGDPSNYPTSLAIPADGVDTPSFATLMTPVKGLADRTAYLRDRDLASGPLNWKPAVATFDPGSIGGTDPGACTVQSVAWDSLLQRWVIAAVAAGSAYLFATHSSGDVLDVITPGPGGVAADVGGVLAGTCDGLGNSIFVKTYSTPGPVTHTSCVLTIASGPITDTAQPFLGTLAQATVVSPLGSGFILLGFEQAGGTYTGHLATSFLGTGLWTDASSTLPAIWQTGTGTVNGVVSAYDPTLSSTYNVLFGMCGAGASRLLGTTPAPIDVTPAFLATRNIKGIAYNVERALWGILCDDGGGVYLYTSPDQVTWTLVKTFQSLSAGGLQAIGGVWIVQLTIVAIGGFPIGSDRIVLSADNGVTWTTASYAMGGDSTTGPMKFPRLVSSGVQLVALNNAQHDFSLLSGFMPAGGF